MGREVKRRTVIVRWTGRGRIVDFRSAIVSKAGATGAPVETRVVGNSVLVEAPETLGTVTSLQFLPGAAWLAAGYEIGNFEEIGRTAGDLAENYLRKGGKFSVEAEGTGKTVASDAAGAATSRILENIKGARVSSDAPRVKFRIAFDGNRGAVGVQLREGPGGVATGSESVVCLVSGGPHSSVVSWMAALAGYRIRLVHAWTTDSALLGVAQLYSELSHRMDPRRLSVKVLRGWAILSVLGRHISRSKGEIFGGFRRGHDTPQAFGYAVSSPLSLLPEERFSEEFAGLGIRGDEAEADWGHRTGERYSSRVFGGVTADVSDVLDGLA